MEDTDLLQRLSEYSTFFNKAHQDYNILISNVAEATNCEDRTWVSVEKFEKPFKKLSSNLMYNMYNQMSSVVGETMNVMKDIEELKSCLIRSQVIKSYSQAVLKASPNTTITEESLKKAVQKALSEEDRSRNVLIFGLKETDEEKLHFEAV